MERIFFHIGFHKTGTTWMQSVLFEKNPAFNLINNYLQPWNDELCINIIHKDEYDFDPELCRSIIEKRSKEGKIDIVSAERLSGHPISSGYDSEIIARRIKAISSDAKVIIVTREPKKFIPSVYRQMVKAGYAGTLREYLIDYPWKRTGSPKKYLLQEKIVDYYLKLFGEKNVLLLDFNEFKNDKSQFISRMKDFMELKDLIITEEDQNMKVNNNSYSDKRLKALRLINRVRKSEYNPHPLIGINSRTAKRLSYLLSVFFNRNGFIDQGALDEFLS